jgi:hypothetical protein
VLGFLILVDPCASSARSHSGIERTSFPWESVTTV